jgi:hypothetical protein
MSSMVVSRTLKVMALAPLRDIASILQRRLNVQLAARARECGKAATKDEKANFTTKVTKHALSKAEGSTKLKVQKYQCPKPSWPEPVLSPVEGCVSW